VRNVLYVIMLVVVVKTKKEKKDATRITTHFQSQTNKSMNRTRQEFMNHQYIPDISFHLIFCFLTLKELTLISQCSHQFKRMVTNPSFLKMYSRDEILYLLGIGNLSLLINSPINKTIQNIKYIGEYTLNMLPSITQISNLKTLRLEQPLDDSQNFTTLLPCFNHPIPLQSLNELYILIRYGRPDNNCLFQSFSLFPNLHTLNIIFNICEFDSIEISNIVQLQKLQKLKLSSPRPSGKNIQIIIDTVRLLPSLRVLDVHNLFTKEPLMSLRKLCAQPGAPPSLRKICSMYNLSEDPEESARLLEQLTELDSIEVDFVDSLPIPNCFSRWMCHISIYNRVFQENDVKNLVLLKRINFLQLNNCSINNEMLNELLCANASRRIKKLILNYMNNSIISFQILSKLTEITHLHLISVRGTFLESEFHLLYNCKKLEEIIIINSGFHWVSLNFDQKQELIIPSKILPSLKKIILQ
jgi:hypothetical protein